MGTPLDQLGITVCSVAGTNFRPYVKFLGGLGIPFAVITDWDPRDDKRPLGYNRSLDLVSEIERLQTGEEPEALIEELKALTDYNDFGVRCEHFGVFTNAKTLEIDLFEEGFAAAIIATLREQRMSAARKAVIDGWEAEASTIDEKILLDMIEVIGKGRFAQRLTSHTEGVEPPAYIADAIRFVAGRV